MCLVCSVRAVHERLLPDRRLIGGILTAPAVSAACFDPYPPHLIRRISPSLQATLVSTLLLSAYGLAVPVPRVICAPASLLPTLPMVSLFLFRVSSAPLPRYPSFSLPLQMC